MDVIVCTIVHFIVWEVLTWSNGINKERKKNTCMSTILYLQTKMAKVIEYSILSFLKTPFK